jgi:Ca2+-binding RTX toxin-like protein
VNNNTNNNTVVVQQQVVQQQQQVQQVLVQAPTPPVVIGPPNFVPSNNGNNTPLAATDNYQVIDEAAGFAYHTPGAAYSGNVAGITSEYININTTNLDVTAITPNAFIKTGSGNDTLQAFTGRNVLDAGAGSNVMVGGNGKDTFIATAGNNTVDLIKNFHGGDDAVINGLNANDFTLNFTDANGAYGAELQLSATSNATGSAAATVALAGFTTGDLNSGRLSVSFSVNQQTSTPYLLIHANS